MKLNSRTKKILLLALIAVVAVTTMTGCSVPHDDDGNVILITSQTSFGSTFQDESWFSALFVWPLAQLINWLTPKVGVALAIALITIIVNGLVAVLTFRSQIDSQQMQLMQPELQKIQRKYEGRTDTASQQRQAAEMQKLYQKYDVNPASSMLAMFIQFPLIIAMYMSVQRSYEVQNSTFMGLSVATTMLNAIKAGSIIAIVIYVLMMGCQFLSMKVPTWLAEKAAEKEAEKHHKKPDTADNPMNNKFMMIYMIGMIAVFGLMLPVAMSLYWAINSLVNVVKSFAVQKAIDQHKANKKGGSK